MTKMTAFSAAALSLISTAALAGNGEPIAISEPGILGIFAGGVILALAIARRAKK